MERHQPKGHRHGWRKMNCDDITAADTVESYGALKTPDVSSNRGPASREEVEEDISEDPQPTHTPVFANSPSLSIFSPSSSSATMPTQHWDPGPGVQSVTTHPCLMNGFRGSVQQISEASGGCVKVQQQEARNRKGITVHCKAAKQTKLTQITDQTVSAADLNPLGVSGTQSDSAISQQEIRSRERLFYGAHIGSETRNMEFKRGGGEYLRSLFRSHLRRYACAFLNSGGGSLLVGVDDDGIVQGISCNHRQEDRVRLLVDSILKFFHPPLLPHSYSLAFVPVVKPGPEGVHLKVLRLTLRPFPTLSLPGLYQTDQGEIFLRRDGSVEGPLNASAIQEWARQKWGRDVMRLQQLVETMLAEQRLLLQEIRHQRTVISSLQNTHTCLNTHSHHPQPASLRERLRRTLGKFSSRTALIPCDARRCQCALTILASSVVPVSSPTQMAPDCDMVTSSPSNVSDPSLSSGHSLACTINLGPGPRQCQQREGQGQKLDVPACSICSVM